MTRSRYFEQALEHLDEGDPHAFAAEVGATLHRLATAPAPERREVARQLAEVVERVRARLQDLVRLHAYVRNTRLRETSRPRILEQNA